MANLVASGTYPFVQFQPSETSGVWHTDQEFTDSGGNSYLFRMYNAAWDSAGPNWKTLGGGDNAYATVQNPDGSIHYYWNGGVSTWTEWVGSDNNTVYNALDFGLSAGGSASGNSTALTSTFTAVLSAPSKGGAVSVPEFGYQVESSSTGIQVPYNMILQGLGTSGLGQDGASDYFHFSINGTGSTSSGNAFFATAVGAPHSSGGTLIQNLGFIWIGSANAADTCISLNSGWNVRATNCFFVSCPIVMNCDALVSGLDGSSIKYQAGAPNNAVAVILQSPQCFAAGPGEYAQDAVNPSEGGGAAGPTNCVAVMICGGPLNGEHCWVRDLHLSEFSYGVCFNTVNAWGGTDFCTAALNDSMPLSSGSSDAVVTNVECQAFVTAIYIQPKSDTDPIYGVKVSDSFLIKCQNSTDGHAIAYVDTNGGANQNVSDVEFVNCTIFSNVTTSGSNTGVPQNNQYGLQINAGDNLRVIGGRISNMGTKSTPQSDGTANIAITGAVGLVTIDAVNLSAAAAIATQQRPSQWGLLVTGDITGPINVSNCNFGTSGWGTSGPVSVTGTVSASNPLYITNCPGYNDQNTTINTLTHISTGTAYHAANQGANGGTSYFGPSFVMFTANNLGGTFQYNGGAAQSLVPNQVVCLTLASPYDTIEFNTHVPTTFAWIGK